MQPVRERRLQALGTNTLTVSANAGFGAVGGQTRSNSQSLTMEVAEALAISPATVKRDWMLAQAWLRRELVRR